MAVLPEAGQWALVSHWRGPVVYVTKVTPKRIYLDHGVCDPSDVRAVFADEQSAEDGLKLYRAAWAAAQPELKVFENAERQASLAVHEARNRLKEAAWAAVGQ